MMEEKTKSLIVYDGIKNTFNFNGEIVFTIKINLVELFILKKM